MAIDPSTEPLFDAQWYLENTGQTGGAPGADINIRPAWTLASGQGVRIAVNDTGINPDDPDLAGNLDLGLGGNFTTTPPTGDVGPDPEFGEGRWHGTAVASMAAAADNGTGLLGAAPDASLASLVGLGTEGALARYRNHDVVNASWGVRDLFRDDFNTPDFATAGEHLRAAAESGRDGLGTVTVFAAGNDFSTQGLFGLETGVGDANYHNFQNSRFTLSVAALDDQGTFAAPGNPAGFTTPGAPVLVAAPGTQVPAADLPAPQGNNPQGETTVVSGTSFAAPLVSGVSALMLEANPELGYRDVREILAYSAQQNDPGQEQWRLNGAETWNGGGLHSNPNYGFGLVDAAAAVRLAQSWHESDTAANAAQVAQARSRPIDFNAANSPFEQTVRLDAGVEVETVALDLDLRHQQLGDVIVQLTSPAGTTSTLIREPDSGDFGEFDRDGYRLTSNEFLGESSAGLWTLTVRDQRGDTLFNQTGGTLFDWTLTAYGEPADGDDSYVFTDEYGAYADAAPARQTLADTGGTDTLNAAATSAAVSLDLAPGATSTIAERSLHIAQGTTIENAAGGAGDDTIAGNAAANRLDGGPGADTLRGRGGDDTLIGRGGADVLDGGAGTDTVVFDAAQAAVAFDRAPDGTARASRDGTTDTLLNLELASFTDTGPVPLETRLPPANAAPEPAPDSVTLAAGTRAQVDVLANDSDPDGDALTVTGVDALGPGSAAITDAGTVAVTAAAGAAVQQATLTYTVADGRGGTASGELAVTVTSPPLGITDLATDAQIAALYVGFFGRAPDPVGLDFWLDEANARPDAGGGAVIADIAESFRVSAEAEARYPALDADAGTPDAAAIESFVGDVFANLFDRAPTATDLGFWTDTLRARIAGGEPLGDAIVDIISGAVNAPDRPDRATLTNTVEAARAYAETIGRDAFDQAEARALVDSVTADDASVATALADLGVPVGSDGVDPVLA